MMNDARYLRGETILAALAAPAQGGGRHGEGQAAHASRHKLTRHLLLAREGRRRPRRTNGISDVLALVGPPAAVGLQRGPVGVRVRGRRRVMKRDRPDVMYLSTTDYVQHKHAPGTPEANAFYAMMTATWASSTRSAPRSR
jgi:phosphonoacetate hydrolase